MRYAVSEIPAAKVLMGMTLYGYDWLIPWQKGRLAAGMANNSAEGLADQEQVPITWDAASSTPMFRYRSADGTDHEVWFDDAMSAALKMNLVYEFGLRGLSFWLLGYSFPQNWHLVRESFQSKQR